jgi:hypothetical protein
MNSMFVYHQKCFVLHYFLKISTYHYFLGVTPVSSADSVRDLGIHFDNQLKFHKHVSIISRNANYSLLWIKRSFMKFNLHTFMTLYKTIIRLVVEYCSSVWYPTWKCEVQQIERVQHWVSKFVPYLSHLPYQH